LPLECKSVEITGAKKNITWSAATHEKRFKPAAGGGMQEKRKRWIGAVRAKALHRATQGPAGKKRIIAFVRKNQGG